MGLERESSFEEYWLCELESESAEEMEEDDEVGEEDVGCEDLEVEAGIGSVLAEDIATCAKSARLAALHNDDNEN